jgi:hypothetical protein
VGVRQLLLHGLLAGLVAGFVAFGVASVVGEPAVEAAIALEGQAAAPSGGEHDHAHDAHSHDEAPDHGEEAAVSRATQSGVGLAIGTVASGLVLGGLLGLVAAAAMGRLAGLGPVASTALVGGVGAVAFALVPFWKYPATPPAAGDPTTIDERTATFFGFVALSVLAAVAATWLAVRLVRAGRGGYAACATAAVGYVAVVGLAAAVLPAAEVGDFPGQLLWEFRSRALVVVVALWGTLVLVTTGLVDRSWRAVRVSEERRAFKESL